MSWAKCNYDGAALGILNMAACVVRNHNAVNLGCFVVNKCIRCALSAELIGELYACYWNCLFQRMELPLVTLAFMEQ